MNLEKCCSEVVLLVEKVGDFIRYERLNFTSAKIEIKGKHDFVTHVDKGAEKRLVDGLGIIVPGSGFIAEEGTSTFIGEVYNWIIDPIDGTTNFIHGAPPYAISVALSENGKIILGVILDVASNECFFSYTGAPVYLNNQIVNVSGVEKVAETLIATGFPYENYGRLNQFMNTLDYFFHHSHGVRRLGSAATDLAWVACGRYDAFYEYNLKPWDVAAGAFLVIQAGGRVGDFKGGEDYLFGKEIVASNSLVFDEFQQIINSIMNA